MSALSGEGKVSLNRGPKRKSETPHPLNAQKKRFLSLLSHITPVLSLTTWGCPCRAAVVEQTIKGLDSKAVKPGIDKLTG